MSPAKFHNYEWTNTGSPYQSAIKQSDFNRVLSKEMERYLSATSRSEATEDDVDAGDSVLGAIGQFLGDAYTRK